MKCGKTFYGIISYADFIAVYLVDITGGVYFAVRYKYLKIGLLGKYRDMIFLRENFKPRNMVGMCVCDKNSLYHSRVDLVSFQSLTKTFAGYSCVNKYPAVTVADKELLPLLDEKVDISLP